MRRYNIENRKGAPECMDEPTFDELPFGHTWDESDPKFSDLIGEGGVLGALFLTAFGTPFLGAGLFTLIEGVNILLNDGLFGLFLIFFSLPFIGVGGMVVFGGLYNIGIGIGIIKQKDTVSTPRITTKGSEFIQTERPDKIQFPNPLKIEVDGKVTDFQLGNQTELSYEAIRQILTSNEFWIINLDANRQAFFQMHIESGLIEYWTDGVMQHQQSGDIDDALKYLESIMSEENVQQSEDLVDVFKQQLEHSIQQQELDVQVDNEIKSVSKHLVKDSETIQTHSDKGTGLRLRKRVAMVIFTFVGLLLFTPLGAIIDEVFEEEIPDTWCDGTNHYPVTVPIQMESVEVSWYHPEGNRNTGSDSQMELAINGGVCNYQYRVGNAEGFEFTYRLGNATNIDGVSILVMDHPLGLTNGYSTIYVKTSTDNGSTWEWQYGSAYMFGGYEREAVEEVVHPDFAYNKWFRHQFDRTVNNVTHVQILFGTADQLEDTAVSFSALRIDAEGDYDYPDFRLCNTTWDGRFVNSTSDMIEWPVHDGSLGC